MIRYDGRAEFQIDRRRITKEWIEETLRNPDKTEVWAGRQSLSEVSAGRHVMLRVVTARNDPEHVIAAYFDRTRPCE